MIKYIAYASFCIIWFFGVYKWIRHIDMKNRKFVKEWEKEYIEAYKDLWKEQYFLKLAEEKKIKEVEKRIALEKKEQKDRLKEVHADDEDEKEYLDALDEAIKKLEEEEIQ